MQKVGIAGCTVYHRVAARSHPGLLRQLEGLGWGFSVTSTAAIDDCLAAGADPAKIVLDRAVNTRFGLREATARGVRRYVADCEMELDKVIDETAGSIVSVRVDCQGRSAGCDPERALGLVRRAASYGLTPTLSFRVGSGTLDPMVWDRALAVIADMRAELRAEDLEIAAVELGGELPARPDQHTGSIDAAIRRRLGPAFPPEVILVVEPSAA